MLHTQLTKISPAVQSTLRQLLDRYEPMRQIVDAIVRAGGVAYLVGGAVRDLMREVAVKDIDCEVHGMTLDKLQQVLQQFGSVDEVGKSFGVLRVRGLDVDWSVPRKDSAGRKPKVEVGKDMTIQEAFCRRDLTINAMAIDLHTFMLLDPFGGLADLAQGRLKAVNERTFIEDPLRFFRVMQFIGRFAMMPDDQLNQLCAKMDLSTISRERIEAEFEKLFLKSKRPSLGIRWLQSVGRIKEILPELAATIGVEQNPAWHPEGDVFEHTMQAIDAAAALEYENNDQKLTILYATLCHDLGKVTTSKLIGGVIRSPGHAQAGIPMARALLKRITAQKDLIDAVLKLVDAHMYPGEFVKQKASLAAYKRLAKKLYPQANLAMLAQLSRADKRGRNAQSHEPLTTEIKDVEEFMLIAAQARVAFKPEEPLVNGRDLLAMIEPGKEMGTILDELYRLQIESSIASKEQLLVLARGMIKKR